MVSLFFTRAVHRLQIRKIPPPDCCCVFGSSSGAGKVGCFNGLPLKCQNFAGCGLNRTADLFHILWASSLLQVCFFRQISLAAGRFAAHGPVTVLSPGNTGLPGVCSCHHCLSFQCLPLKQRRHLSQDHTNQVPVHILPNTVSF